MKRKSESGDGDIELEAVVLGVDQDGDELDEGGLGLLVGLRSRHLGELALEKLLPLVFVVEANGVEIEIDAGLGHGCGVPRVAC